MPEQSSSEQPFRSANHDRELDSRLDSDADLRAEGARHIKGVLSVTEEQVNDARREMADHARRKIAASSDTGRLDVGQSPDPTNVDRREVLSDTERKVREVVSQIRDSAVYGKFPDGTHFQTGDQPEVAIHRSDWDDFGLFPPDSELAGAVGVCKRISVLYQGQNHVKQLGARADVRGDRHYLLVAPIPVQDGQPTEAVVDYFFTSDYVDAQGRPGYLVHALSLMPIDAASDLKELVRTDSEAAELFFQQAAQGLEGPGTGPGVGRTESPAVVLLGDWEAKNPPLDKLGRKKDAFDAVFSEVDELAYSRPHGTVAPR